MYEPLNPEERKILYRFPENRGTAVDIAYIKSMLGEYGHYADRSTPRDQVMGLVDRGLVRIVTHPKHGTGYEYFELTKDGQKLKKRLRKGGIESLIGSFSVILSLVVYFYGLQINVITGSVIKNIATDGDKIGIAGLTIILFIFGLYLISKNLRRM